MPTLSKTTPDCVSWRINVGEGCAHAVMVMVGMTMAVVVGAGTVVVLAVTPMQEQAQE